MARGAAGTIFEKPVNSGRFYARFTTTSGRKTIRLVTCSTRAQARQRQELLATELERLRRAGHGGHAEKLLELAAVADELRLVRIRKGVDAIVAGEAKPIEAETPLTDTGPTFREFAEEWTGGALHARFPDHVKRKKTANEDVYRLVAHVYPIIGELPIRHMRLEDAERVMRKLDPVLAVGSRRQVAQLLHRVMALAAYPARLIEASPIPEGFLPKPTQHKAQAWLYPAEEQRLLACPDVPILYRLFYGVLAREGLRRDEALSLTWSSVDLERGIITLDANKTGDPRAWVLSEDVRRALRIWHRDYCPGLPGDVVFSSQGQTIDRDHVAAVFRTHLRKAGGVRAELFERTATRMPIRLHDLRATFVTLGLACGRTETWVCDRTGHRSSQMLSRYRRAARTAAELGLGSLVALDEGIPEFQAGHRESTSRAPTVDEPQQDAPSDTQANELDRKASARDRLVGVLTESIRELLLQGDSAGARVAIDALLGLAGDVGVGRVPAANVAVPGVVPPDTLRSNASGGARKG
ncbi:MAG: tyrosine-type recombinase/integrase [Polyangiaceae bacterium]|nr:tyrosine-type recombinase/integrase [Polyangiaceae bacterium]